MLGLKPRHSKAVSDALREAERILPASGEVEDLLKNLSESRGRPMRLLEADLERSVSGLLICTEKSDYVAVSSDASPERRCAVICHEVAHALLGHDDHDSLSSTLVDTGLLTGLDEELVEAVVAARHAYAHADEADAEIVATHVSAELRRRVLRGGQKYHDTLWS